MARIVSRNARCFFYMLNKYVVALDRSKSQFHDCYRYWSDMIKNSKEKKPRRGKASTSTPKQEESPPKRPHLSIEYENPAGQQWEPPLWRKMLANIKEMRENVPAPVDTMGAHQCADKEASPEVFRYQILVSLILSTQTKDEVTHAAVQRLREHGLTVENISRTSEDELAKIIHPVGFAKTKAKYLKQTTEILMREYYGDIPSTLESLCQLPGVGPKVACLAMTIAWGDPVGIGVDTHVHRLVNRLGWVQKTTKNPEQTRRALEAWMPRELWSDINSTLVGFGQTICKAKDPDCQNCLNNSICPFYLSKPSMKTPKTRKQP